MKKHLKRIIILAAITAAVAAFFFFDLGQYLTLEYIKAQRASFDAYYEAHRATVIGVYMAIYVAVTALSLPGAAVMTLLGGAIFGLLVGTVVVSFASTIGATLACFVSRFVLRDWVQGRFEDKLRAVNAGIEREGPFYLFTLRLIPVFPFFIINLVMGLTRMPLRTFYWVSQVGMLPGTIVYVNAGKELGQIESLSGILSPGVIGAFVLLGIFPIAVKKLMALYRKKKGVAPVAQTMGDRESGTNDTGEKND
jgi:uncharacterized membrane protein YdjX (TVP38/TMEM64 family)